MARALVFHKNPISARLRLLRFADGGLIGPDPLPPGTAAADAPDAAVSPLPGPLAADLGRAFAVPAEAFSPLVPVLAWAGDVPVFAVECVAPEPPADLAAKAGGGWIDFLAVRTLPDFDRAAAHALYARLIGS